MEALKTALGHIGLYEWIGMEQGVTDFGWALRALKAGAKIFRPGWNAPGQYVVLQKGYPQGIAINGNTAEATGLPVGTVVIFRPYFMIHLVDGSFCPWVPSVTDCLADDWLVKEL